MPQTAPNQAQPSPGKSPNFGLIIIGDEILSGKRADKHLPQVIELLKARGRHSARELTGRLGHAMTHPGQAEVEPAPLAGAELEAAE